MNYQNPTHIVTQPATGFRVQQNLRRRKAYGLPGGSALWFAASKISLTIFAVVFGLSLWLGSAVTHVVSVNQTIEAKRHNLKDKQITLLAERAHLMSARQVHKLAEMKLALFVPEKEQVYKIR